MVNTENLNLTTWNFAEMDVLRMRRLPGTCGEVGVLVALVQPRIVVSRKALWCCCTRLHAMLQTFEFPGKLCSSRNVESLVDAQDLHYSNDNNYL